MNNNQDYKESISFQISSDPIQSAGLATLVEHLDCRTDVSYSASNGSLTIYSDDIKQLLSDIFQDVGKEYYDISTKKMLERNEGFYYKSSDGTFVRYPKVKPIGYAQLINDSRPLPLKVSTKVSALDPQIKEKLHKFALEEGLSVKEKDTIYIDDRNSAVPCITGSNWTPGSKTCMVCGDKFESTHETVKFSPFLGGKSAGLCFVTMTKKPEEACWKCMFLNRISVGKFLYYSDSKGTKFQNLYCFSFNVDSFEGLVQVNNKFLPAGFMLDKFQKSEINYRTNFKLISDEFGCIKLQHFHEFLLSLLFTVYNKYKTMLPADNDIISLINIENTLNYDTNVFYIFAKKFGSTLRPQLSGEYSETNYIFQLFDLLSKQNISMKSLFHDIVDYSYLSGAGNQKYDLAVSIRDKWAKAVLNKQSTLSMIERVVCTNKDRNPHSAVKFSKAYESYINYGGNMAMNDEIRDLAIKLGSQIGMAVNEKKNLKAGKSKIIQLRKARNLRSFNDVIISMQFKFGIIVGRDLLDSINEDNFEYVRQFTVIQALNICNANTKNSNKETNNEQ